MKRIAALSIALLLFTFNTAHAQDESLIKRTVLSQTDLEGTDDREVIVALLVVQPGAFVQRHIHHGEEYAYFLQGQKVKTSDGKVRELKTGTMAHYVRGQAHAGFTVMGEHPLKLLTTHIVDKNKPLLQPVAVELSK